MTDDRSGFHESDETDLSPTEARAMWERGTPTPLKPSASEALGLRADEAAWIAASPEVCGRCPHREIFHERDDGGWKFCMVPGCECGR